ncbi:hypothetical protein IQ225_02440 [Synechocystis salina LEGE 06155]|nr:hypothetical protein [Synechocystis salina LEGE 06155]
MLTPYLFTSERETAFSKRLNTLKNGYFWANVLETGTGVTYTSLDVKVPGLTYFLVEPSVDDQPFILPEDFLEMLSAHSYAIRELSEKWYSLLKRHKIRVYNSVDFALSINFESQRIAPEQKNLIWRGQEEIDF